MMDIFKEIFNFFVDPVVVFCKSFKTFPISNLFYIVIFNICSSQTDQGLFELKN